jgi:thiol-disulfide isomerase/thioredoxin
MNTKIIIGVVALVVIAGGIGIYSSQNSKPEMMQKEEGAMMQKEVMEKNDAMVKKEEGAMMQKDEGAMMKVGSYESYEASKIAMASASHDVVLFFRASWCPSCRAVDADIKANLKSIPESLTILDVNYDNSTELKKKYGVTSQHTFVQVDTQGNLVKKWSGGSTLASILTEVK